MTIRGSGVCVALVACGLLAPPAALASDELVRGIIGLGTAIMLNEAQKQQRPPPPRYVPQKQYAPNKTGKKAGVEVKSVSKRRQVQRRLNELGFNAGAPDGVFGPRTRRAIAAFQASIGTQPDGTLSDAEVDILLDPSTGFAVASNDGGWGASPPSGNQGAGGGFPVLGAPTAGSTGGSANGGFPSLGGSAGSGQGNANGSGFPVLGMAPTTSGAEDSLPGLGSPADASGQGSGSGFPGIAASPNGSGAAGTGSAFPALGAAPAPSASGQASGDELPGLGTPPVGAVASMAGSGFPALGATPPASQEESGSSFPAVAAVSDGDGESGNGFPGLATASDGAPGSDQAYPDVTGSVPNSAQTEMPAVASAPAQDPLAFPQVEQPGDAAGATAAEDRDPLFANLRPTTFEAEVANTVYGSVDAQPDVLGITLGQNQQAARDVLDAEGFADCDSGTNVWKCVRQTDTLNDAIDLRVDGGRVWAIVRRITFNQPAPVALVMERFASTYPMLFAESDLAVSSGDPCDSSSLSMSDLVSALDNISSFQAEPDVAAAGVAAGYASACPLVYRVDFQMLNEGIGLATIVFVDATATIGKAIAFDEERTAKTRAKRDKLSKDLKL